MTRALMTITWTPALRDAVLDLVAEPVTTSLDEDIRSRAREYFAVAVGHVLLPHQIEYTTMLVQRLDYHAPVRDSHAAFKTAWTAAQPAPTGFDEDHAVGESRGGIKRSHRAEGRNWVD